METDLVEAIARRGGFDAAKDLFPRILAAAVTAAARVATEYWLRPETDAPYSVLLRDAVSTAAAIADGQILSESAGP